MRGMPLLPQRGDKPEWQHNQDYWAEKDEFPAIDLKDKAFVYGSGRTPRGRCIPSPGSHQAGRASITLKRPAG